MNKYIALLALLPLSTALAADAPDCSTPVLINLRTLQYQTKADFPNTPKVVRTNVWETKKPTTVCGVTFTPKGNVMTIKTDDNDVYGYLTTPDREARGIVLAGSTPGLLGHSGLEVRLSLFDLDAKYSAEAMIPAEMSASTTVGVRIDGGKLQPLYWPGKGGYTVSFPKTVKTIDIYVKTSKLTNWERVTVDRKARTMTIYRKFAFPNK